VIDPILLALPLTATTATMSAVLPTSDPVLECALEDCPREVLLKAYRLERAARIAWEARAGRGTVEREALELRLAEAQQRARELEGLLVAHPSAGDGCSLGTLGVVCGACLLGGAAGGAGVAVGVTR
jgi:hypothetical protein